jgi:rod shape determining protein RodA
MRYLGGANSTRLDKLLTLSWIILLGIGISLIYSATYNEGLVWYKAHWFKQLVYTGVGLLLLISVSFTKLNKLYNISYGLYGIGIGFLVFLAVGGGIESHGAGRWIQISGFRFQPSEFAKVAYILALGRVLSERKPSLLNLKDLAAPLVLFIIPFILILKQPNLSTALSFGAITLCALYWRGMKLRELFLLLSPIFSVVASVQPMAWNIFIVVLSYVLWKGNWGKKLIVLIVLLNIMAGYGSYFVWNKLHNHQRQRILTFVDPMRDPQGQGYQVIQSKLAIGSGGVFGKGFGKGSQTNLDFLPEEHTDFIFSVLGEQFGFVRAVIVVFLFGLLLWRIWKLAALSQSYYAGHILVCSGAVFLFHVFVNIAMTLGMIPVTGLPLPFMSYGGTFLMTCMVMLGMVYTSISSNDD